MGNLHRRLLALALCACLPAGVTLAEGLRELATVPENALEGLLQRPDGSLLVSDAGAHQLWQVDADGTTRVFAKLDAVPLAIVPFGEGYAVTAQLREPDRAAIARAGGPPAIGLFSHLGPEVLLLDAKGRVLRRLPGKDGSFFNGLERLGDALLVSDSTAATIWRVDPRSGTIRPWLRSPLLAGVDGRFPGANGVQLAGRHLYIANSSANALYRVAVDAAGEALGGLEHVADVAGPDDFAVAADGTILLPSADRLLAITPGGSQSVLASNCTGCDAARLSRDARTLFVVTHGFGPDPGPGRVHAFDTGSRQVTSNTLGLKVHHITARVRDIVRATAWYHDVLGLAVTRQGERMQGALKFADLRMPGFGVSLVQLAQPATEVAAGQPLLPDWVHIVFSSPDPDALYRSLQARGEHLAMHGPPPSGPVQTFLVYDSEGNEIEIVPEDEP